MVTRNTSLYQKLDWVTILIYFVLLAIGWANINSASYNLEAIGGLSRPMLQLIWIGTGLLLGGVILLIDAKAYNVLSYFIYGAIIILLIVTLFVAKDIKGSRSWLVIGPVRLQPAEFAKFATALALAKVISAYEFTMDKFRCWWKPLALLLLPMGIIVLQQETGSALVFLAFFLMLYREGMSGKVLLLGVSAGVLAILSIVLGEKSIGIGGGNWGIFSALLSILIASIGTMWVKLRKRPIWWWLIGTLVVVFLIVMGIDLWSPLKINLAYVLLGEIGVVAIYGLVVSFLQINRGLAWGMLIMVAMAGFSFSINYVFNNVFQDYQQDRIKVFLGMIEDPKGIGYNTEQAKIAIGSGGFFGKGYLEGTQTKLSYVPEQETDFIFCTIGEEWGFVGTLSVLAIYMFLLFRIIYLAERQNEVFNRVYGYCVASIIFFHIVVNVGMVIGLMPVIGIPLPLISYGGSSLWAFTILLFIFLKLDATRSVQLR